MISQSFVEMDSSRIKGMAKRAMNSMQAFLDEKRRGLGKDYETLTSRYDALPWYKRIFAYDPKLVAITMRRGKCLDKPQWVDYHMFDYDKMIKEAWQVAGELLAATEFGSTLTVNVSDLHLLKCWDLKYKGKEE